MLWGWDVLQRAHSGDGCELDTTTIWKRHTPETVS